MSAPSPVVVTYVRLYLALAPQSLCSIALKKGPPQRREELKTVLARPGEVVKIVCPAYGSPHPIIQWSKVLYYNVLLVQVQSIGNLLWSLYQCSGNVVPNKTYSSEMILLVLYQRCSITRMVRPLITAGLE